MTRRTRGDVQEAGQKDPFLVEVGRRVREIRTRQRLTQAQAAEAANIPQATLFQTEAGIQNLQLKTLVKLAKGLGTSVRDLMPVPVEVTEAEKPAPQTLDEVLERLEVSSRETMRLSQLAVFLRTLPQQEG
ncbi:helix-turn-helix domain-containing protein [Roseomonas populi]|uniref:Helix-turn-helix domain-containing protein n=1 Tax=Roseomonas populi TaxID=3121582 RepID=A0ABT1X7M8_9PROT|nr:helix-turn-helix transcriptional regulator [Roseomonas pecuniae]MCR0984113.1 helix-turn-helix domain-containing protein [Roseomonas pecuniae]